LTLLTAIGLRLNLKYTEIRTILKIRVTKVSCANRKERNQNNGFGKSNSRNSKTE
jgi:hypothetical protein